MNWLHHPQHPLQVQFRSKRSRVRRQRFHDFPAGNRVEICKLVVGLTTSVVASWQCGLILDIYLTAELLASYQ